MLYTAFAGVVELLKFLPENYLSSDHYPNLAKLKIEKTVSDCKRSGITICIGSKHDEVKCYILKDAGPLVIDLQVKQLFETFQFNENQSFLWKDVTQMAYSQGLLYLSTIHKRLFVVAFTNTFEYISNNDLTKIGKNFSQVGIMQMRVHNLDVKCPLLEVEEARGFEIHSMGANEQALFLISNGKLFSLGYNLEGAAARGQKNLQQVNLGECEIKFKKRAPHFIKVVGFNRRVIALSNNRSIYVCGESAGMYSISESSGNYPNFYMFKQLDVPYHFIDIDFGHAGIFGTTKEFGIVKIQRGAEITVRGVESELSDEDSELSESEEEDEEEEEPEEEGKEERLNETKQEIENGRKIVKYMQANTLLVTFYNDHSVEIEDENYSYPFKFTSPYANSGKLFELDCLTWQQSPMHKCAYFFWKLNKVEYETVKLFRKKLKSCQEYQVLGDISIIFI